MTSHWGTPRKDMGLVEVFWDGNTMGTDTRENIASRRTTYAVGNDDRTDFQDSKCYT